MNRFKSKKAVWWSVGLSCLLLGFFAYLLFVPHLVTPLGDDAPDMDVPSMRNVPENPGALHLDVPDPQRKQAIPRPQ